MPAERCAQEDLTVNVEGGVRRSTGEGFGRKSIANLGTMEGSERL